MFSVNTNCLPILHQHKTWRKNIEQELGIKLNWFIIDAHEKIITTLEGSLLLHILELHLYHPCLWCQKTYVVENPFLALNSSSIPLLSIFVSFNSSHMPSIYKIGVFAPNHLTMCYHFKKGSWLLPF